MNNREISNVWYVDMKVYGKSKFLILMRLSKCYICRMSWYAYIINDNLEDKRPRLSHLSSASISMFMNVDYAVIKIMS